MISLLKLLTEDEYPAQQILDLINQIYSDKQIHQGGFKQFLMSVLKNNGYKGGSLKKFLGLQSPTIISRIYRELSHFKNRDIEDERSQLQSKITYQDIVNLHREIVKQRYSNYTIQLIYRIYREYGFDVSTTTNSYVVIAGWLKSLDEPTLIEIFNKLKALQL